MRKALGSEVRIPSLQPRSGGPETSSPPPHAQRPDASPTPRHARPRPSCPRHASRPRSRHSLLPPPQPARARPPSPGLRKRAGLGWRRWRCHVLAAARAAPAVAATVAREEVGLLEAGSGSRTVYSDIWPVICISGKQHRYPSFRE
ncbi:Matrix metalloproteinase-16 [Manis javanica]|nr:Matrix metalloproteinase-16 [Manis javanica]